MRNSLCLSSLWSVLLANQCQCLKRNIAAAQVPVWFPPPAQPRCWVVAQHHTLFLSIKMWMLSSCVLLVNELTVASICQKKEEGELRLHGSRMIKIWLMRHFLLQMLENKIKQRFFRWHSVDHLTRCPWMFYRCFLFFNTFRWCQQAQCPANRAAAWVPVKLVASRVQRVKRTGPRSSWCSGPTAWRKLCGRSLNRLRKVRSIVWSYCRLFYLILFGIFLFLICTQGGSVVPTLTGKHLLP